MGRVYSRIASLLLALPATLLAQQAPAGQVIDTVVEYEPVREPHFVPASQANFLKDEDHVMGVSENGVSKAYRTDIIAWHHIVHDQLGKMPILATW
jgi:hypothetical protein